MMSMTHVPSSARFESAFELFQLMVPADNTTDFGEVMTEYPMITVPGIGRSAMTLGGYQMLALFTTFLVAIIGGTITVLLLRLPCFDNVSGYRMFDDRELFSVEGQGFPFNEDGGFEEDANNTKYKNETLNSKCLYGTKA